MDNSPAIEPAFSQHPLGRGESPAQVTMPMDHGKQLSPRLPNLEKRGPWSESDCVTTMPAAIVPPITQRFN